MSDLFVVSRCKGRKGQSSYSGSQRISVRAPNQTLVGVNWTVSALNGEPLWSLGHIVGKVMSIAILEIHPGFVGEVSGVDATQPLTKDAVLEIQTAIDQYAVLIFRDQQLTDDQQVRFTRYFGEIENPIGGQIVEKPGDESLQTGINDVSNLDKTGKPLARESRPRLFNIGNMLWHSDSSYRAIPAKYSLLSARILNPRGGNTEFADMRAAYDELDADIKQEIASLTCEHSQMYSRGTLGFLDFTEDEQLYLKPVRQSLVRLEKATGRRSLFLSAHAGTILGMAIPEARILLCDLTEHATQPKFVYVHKWRLHDLVMWDNRRTMHRVRRYDERQPRDMRRTTVAGDHKTAAQA